MVKELNTELATTHPLLLSCATHLSHALEEGWNTWWSTSMREASQGISSWILGSREEALKLGPAWGGRTGGENGTSAEGGMEED